jgi:signal transduction histidine kinase/ActR/RegA family two-component response regulator
MNSPITLVSIQYALALLIGQDLNLRLMLRKFLPPALKLLNGNGAYLWLHTCEPAAPQLNGIEPCYSYPRLHKGLAAHCDALAQQIQALVATDWRGIPPHAPLLADGRYYHFLMIGSSGLLVLQRDAPLSSQQLLALEPVLKRLETACLACLQHAALEEARQHALQAQAAAEQANQAKSDFLARISHEIRTPMNGVLGLTDLMLYSEVSPAQRGYLEMIKTSSNALLDIINEILDFSRIEAGALQLHEQAFQLHALLQPMFVPLAWQAHEKALTLNWTIAPDCPTVLEGDAGRLRQIMINLVGNAIKFTASGGAVTIHIHAEADAPAGYARLLFSVRDNGIGIPLDKQASIFQPFQQADSFINRRYGGTGLGLAIAAPLVVMLGGVLQVESRPGYGSHFYFSALFKLSAHPVVVNAAPSVLAKAARALTVLLVEDDPMSRLFTSLLLKQAGHQVVEAANGQEGVARWLEHRVDVILMDTQMPLMDGLQATVLIRQHEYRHALAATPIIALTANALESDRTRCLQAGMTDFLSKPCEVTVLLDTLVQLCISPVASMPFSHPE